MTSIPERLHQAAEELVSALEKIEEFQRRFTPFDLLHLQKDLVSAAQNLEKAAELLQQTRDSGELEGTAAESYRAVSSSIDLLTETLLVVTTASGMDPRKSFIDIIKSYRKFCRAQELLFLHGKELAPVNRFFLEPDLRSGEPRLAAPGPEDTGLHFIGIKDDPYTRGACSVYVPELYDKSRAWPLVAALHGGYSHGRDFMWAWVREARSRGFILMAPGSLGSTWSILDPEIDTKALNTTIEQVTSRWNIDMDRLLLTGFSDGGTFALTYGLGPDSPFTKIAPFSCVLPPMYLAPLVQKKQVYWIHGARDWMFPMHQAEHGYDRLERAGATVTLKILRDLSHAYPREENGGILEWFFK
ncbi:MAG: phospholipase [bacterium]|nr:phospholipase [bacterium]